MRFNLALLPDEESLQNTFSGYAKRHFGQWADSYLLGKDALAHVTLCQFEADNEPAACALFTLWPKVPISVELLDLRQRQGSGRHAGKIWVEFAIRRTEDVMHMQRSCHHHLQSHGCHIFTPAEDYSPHLTLARIPVAIPLPFDRLAFNAMACYPALGLCHENGVFLKCLQK